MLISQDLCLKCPWASFLSDFILSHFQLPFFFFLSPRQVVRMTLILETHVFSFPDSDRTLTCHPETVPQKPINSFKSKICLCVLSTGAGSVPITKDRCNSKEKCKCTCISIGLKNLKQFVFPDLEITVSHTCSFKTTFGSLFSYQAQNTANTALCVIQN